MFENIHVGEVNIFLGSDVSLGGQGSCMGCSAMGWMDGCDSLAHELICNNLVDVCECCYYIFFAVAQ
jgi:hypothetical protein